MRPEEPLWALLRANGTPLKAKTARAFLHSVEKHVQWFLNEGRITAPLWERLGNDLRKADQAEPLPVGTIPIWSLVRGCLKEDKPSCREAIREGEEVLEDVWEEIFSARTSDRGSE